MIFTDPLNNFTRHQYKIPRVQLRYLSDHNKLNTETRVICAFIMRAKINTGQKENKLIKHNGKYEFGRLPGRYQILRQHIIEMETWSLLGARNFIPPRHRLAIGFMTTLLLNRRLRKYFQNYWGTVTI